ncbi:TolB family protein [Nocardioides ochotonae]|uniref:TolB family protein n=1 Tax=Nocardioides ochotonae TaxID=2685869 RepID=UPI001408C365|nr:PD40 domain-containing protein [Nocardioides ochotonae]
MRPTGAGRAARCLTTVGLLVLTCLIVPATPATATFDGENGRIVFRRFTDAEQTTGALFSARPDGSGERQITYPAEGVHDRSPDVSPDGRRIVFQRSGPTQDDIFVVNADGTGLRQLTSRSHPEGNCLPLSGVCNFTPAWSPSGRHIVFSRAFGPVEDDLVETLAVFMMRADGTHLRQLTQLRPPASGATGEDLEPQLSPDGTKVVFRRENVRAARPVDGVAVWVLDLRTGRERRVTPYRMGAGDTPDWSPDGRRIVFTDHVFDTETNANVYTVRPDGRHLRQLTFADDGITRYLATSFSPDGRWITVGKRPSTGGPELNAADVAIMRRDGTDERLVTRTEAPDSYPDWGPRVRSRHVR